MNRAKAEAWASFLLALRGKSGTFYLGDSAARIPRGTISVFSDLLRFTEQFDNAIWVKDGGSTITANTIADPNSNLTADVFTKGGGAFGNFAALTQIVRGNAAYRPYTFSIWLKTASGTVSGQLAISDLSNFTGTTAFTATTSWQRFSFTSTAANYINTGSIGVGINVTGAAGTVIHVWGAQLDLGSAMLSYSAFQSGKGAVVNGASQTGKTLAVSLNLPPQTILKAGDYVETGTGTARRMYKTLTDTVTDGSGNATLDIFPRLRESPAANQNIYWNDTQGTFRLSSNQNSFDIDEALIYGIQFQAVEAI